MGDETIVSKEPRQLSYKPIVKWIVGAVLCFGAAIPVLAYLHGENLYRNVGIALIVIGVILATEALLERSSIKKENEHLRKLDYYLDYDNEVRAFSFIGREIPKKRKNEGVKSYKKYSDWKDDMLSKFKYCIGTDDFYRYLNGKLRNTETCIEVEKTVLIPVELGIIAVFCTGTDLGPGFNIICCFIVSVVLVVIVCTDINRMDDEKNFLTDMCEIVKNQIEEEEKKKAA